MGIKVKNKILEVSTNESHTVAFVQYPTIQATLAIFYRYIAKGPNDPGEFRASSMWVAVFYRLLSLSLFLSLEVVYRFWFRISLCGTEWTRRQCLEVEQKRILRSKTRCARGDRACFIHCGEPRGKPRPPSSLQRIVDGRLPKREKPSLLPTPFIPLQCPID